MADKGSTIREAAAAASNTKPGTAGNLRKADILIRRTAAGLCLVFILAAALFTADFLLCFSSAEQLPAISSYSQIKFVIYGASEQTVSARFWLYDVAGREIASIERSWNANSLSVDFISAEFSGKVLLFPYIIYGNQSYESGTGYNSIDFQKSTEGQKRRGTALSRYYIKNRANILYTFSGQNSDRINRAFNRMTRYALRPDFSGSAQFLYPSKHRSVYTVNLSGCSTGALYSIVIDDKGSITVVL